MTEDENDDIGVDENDDGRDDGGADKNDDGGVDENDDGGDDGRADLPDIGGEDDEDVGEDGQEPLIFSEFEDSEPKGPDLYNNVENQKQAAKDRENVMSWFGWQLQCIGRQRKIDLPGVTIARIFPAWMRRERRNGEGTSSETTSQPAGEGNAATQTQHIQLSFVKFVKLSFVKFVKLPFSVTL
ncbi:hypothetical protein CJ030_MR5G010197 [Morella rubra]|uniref:Uncharacterized protein n=1 Tax=Morella rubra TaxID=262757 RepID=A0A6A1VLU6_9ROSI|nr:hypothetical protein CJ030_MR5G010197 [Morella rubra]